MQPIPIRCIRTVDDLNELYAYVSTKRSELSYTNFTLVNQHHNQLVLHSQTSIMLRIAFYLLIMLVSLVGNVLVIVVIVCNRFMHKSTNYFILNLVVCDLAIVFSCMWVQIVVGESKDWTLGSLFCKVNSFMQMVSILASVFTLVAVSCDRFVAVMYPLRAHLSNRSTFVCIFSIWALSALIALPTFYYRSYSEQHWSDFVQRSCDDMSWPITLVTNELGCVVEVTRVSKRVYFTAVILCLFFLPMIVLLLTCTIMIRKLMGDTHIGELTPSLLTQKNKKKVRSTTRQMINDRPFFLSFFNLFNLNFFYR